MKKRTVLVLGLMLLCLLAAVLPASAGQGTVASLTGAGKLLVLDEFVIPFEYSAIQNADGSAHGQFMQVHPDAVYVGEVTCLAFDPVNQRAWVGGVITYSDDPTPDHQVGDDIWFRVVDYGQGQDQFDRSTVVGFRGAGGILTSEEYCALKLWPDNDARTWPVTHGNIEVRD